MKAQKIVDFGSACMFFDNAGLLQHCSGVIFFTRFSSMEKREDGRKDEKRGRGNVPLAMKVA